MDTITSQYDVKFGFEFSDESDPAEWITFPNPEALSVVRAGASLVENLAVDNNLLIGATYKSAVTKLKDVKIVVKTDTSVDWR